MQAFFRQWADEVEEPPGAGSFVDYAEIGFLGEMNRNLLRECDDEALLAQLAQNLQFARELRQEIVAEASLGDAGASHSADPASTTHLKAVFEALRPAGKEELPRV